MFYSTQGNKVLEEDSSTEILEISYFVNNMLHANKMWEYFGSKFSCITIDDK
jgi:hypothetical protein